MTHRSYHDPFFCRLCSIVLSLSLFVVCSSLPIVAEGQQLGDYRFSTGIDPARWVSLDSTRNLLTNGTSAYYMRSYLEEIGFAFPFADTSYTQFSVTLAGNLRLGGELALTTGNNQGSPFHPTRAGSNNPKINFFGCSGYANENTYVRKQTFGTAPNRMLVVEFALKTYATTSRPALYVYQVHLFENGDIEVVYPSQAPSSMPFGNRQQGFCVDETDLWYVDQNHVATHYTNGCTSVISAGNWPDVNRYYRFNFPVDVCASPTGLSAAMVDTASITLAWRNPAYAADFVVEYGTSQFVPGSGAGTILTVNDTTATITGLSPNTQYHFFVRSVCGVDDTSNPSYVVVRTLQHSPVSEFPYECDFEQQEERDGWYTSASAFNAQWYVGSAVNNTQNGLWSLYISQDSGATNTGGDDWISAYAYRDVNLSAGDWSVGFDWRAFGDWSESSTGITNYYHFLRAFLVPSLVTFSSQSSVSFPASPSSSAVPAGWIDLVPDGHVLVGQSVWNRHESVVRVPAAGCYHLLFYWETDGYMPSIDLPAAVDNISMEHIACPQPQALSAVAGDDEITLSWHRGGAETLWMVRYGDNELYLNDTSLTVSSLSMNTSYTFSVYAICGEGDTSLATTATFSTTAGEPVTSLPYVCDFENGAEAIGWLLAGEGQPNRWCVGEAANNTPQGGYSLYVSQDSGATNTYSGAASSVSYAYRYFVLEQGDYLCSFDWRCMGDGEFHFLRAFMVPAAAVPTAGSFPNNANHYSAVPSGWIDLSGQSHYLSGQPTWATHTQPFSLTDSGLYVLLFMWENDAYTPQDPPAAVDNISVDFLSCPIPSGLAADAMLDAIDLTWNAGDDAQLWLVSWNGGSAVTYTPSYSLSPLTPNTEYTITVQTLCLNGDTSLPASVTLRTLCLPVDTLPFLCDFNSYPSGMGNGESFIPCWNRIRNHSTVSPYVSDYLTTGDNCLYWNLTAGLLDDVCVVLPELGANIEVRYTELRFKARMVDFMGIYSAPTLIVGIMSDPNVVSTFQPVDTIEVTSSTDYVNYAVSMLPYVGSDKYVAIRGTVTGTNYASAICLLDDVELREIPVCHSPSGISAQSGTDTIAVSWIAGSNNASWIVSYADTAVATVLPAFVARGLEADAEYIFRVRAVCVLGDTSEAITGRFRTLPIHDDPNDTTPCLPVTNLQYTQATPWSENAYEFTFTWEGNAPSYEVMVVKDGYGSIVDSIVEGNSFFFNAHGEGGVWWLSVRSLCDDTSRSEWSDSLVFETPICIAIEEVVDNCAVSLYPNPTTGDVTVTLTGVEGSATVSVVDMVGRTVWTNTVGCAMPAVGQCSSGHTRLLIGTNPLAPGSYIVRIAWDGGIIVKRLIKK